MRYFILLFICFGAVNLTACTSTISQAINDDGTVDGDVTFPEMDDATQKEGVFPNLENLANINKGVTKKQLYRLIGRPHFHERNGAREWDYIMKFRQPDQTVKICQYKVVFDTDKIGQSFYWLPDDCYPLKKAVLADKSDNLHYLIPTRVLFFFDKSEIEYIKPIGREQLTVFAQYILASGKDVKVNITGYADHLGGVEYNKRLSEKRAQTVKRYLMALGLPEDSMTAKGMGETTPEKDCDNQSLDKNELLMCLSSERRVIIDIVR